MSEQASERSSDTVIHADFKNPIQKICDAIKCMGQRTSKSPTEVAEEVVFQLHREELIATLQAKHDEELKAMRDIAYKEGHEAGFAFGYSRGKSQGWKDSEQAHAKPPVQAALFTPTPTPPVVEAVAPLPAKPPVVKKPRKPRASRVYVAMESRAVMEDVRAGKSYAEVGRLHDLSATCVKNLVKAYSLPVRADIAGADKSPMSS